MIALSEYTDCPHCDGTGVIEQPTCDECGREFDSEHALSIHNGHIHNEENQLPEGIEDTSDLWDEIADNAAVMAASLREDKDVFDEDRDAEYWKDIEKKARLLADLTNGELK